MVLKICTHEIGIHGVRDVGTDKEAVGIHLRCRIDSTALFCKDFANTFEGTGKEIAVGALTEQGANLFIIKATHNLDRTGFRVCSLAGGDQGFNGCKGAELVIDAACKDELFIEPTELSWLSVKKFELPINDGAICGTLAGMTIETMLSAYNLGCSSLRL